MVGVSFQPLLAYGAAAAPTISLFASATSQDSTTITVPAGVVVGDLLVLFDSSYDSDGITPASAVPSGFTAISDTSSGIGMRIISSRKLAVGGEAGSSLTGMTTGNIGVSKALYVFRRSPVATSLSLSTPQSQITTGNPTAQVQSASAGATPLIVFGFYTAIGTIDPRTFTPAKDGELPSASNVLMYIAYKIYNSAPQDTTIDMDDEGDANGLQSVYITMNG